MAVIFCCEVESELWLNWLRNIWFLTRKLESKILLEGIQVFAGGVL